MATLTVRDENRVLHDSAEIRSFLSDYGVWYRRFEGTGTLPPSASQAAILSAFDQPIRELQAQGGYQKIDVIDIGPDTPGLDAMLEKFGREHWHDEDEVRFVVRGRGLFHLHPQDGPVFSIEVVAGDMINVPKGMRHWFDLCEDRMIAAIRLFIDPAGWAPNYTGSGREARYQPLCFGAI